jgi:hypothetical protein
MADPKPISVTYGANPTPNVDPQPFVIVGDAPAAFEPQEAPVIDDDPADAGAVAADLQAVVDALVAAGILTEPEA